MPATQAQIDALNDAIRQGERIVRFSDGSSVEYRSVADLLRARDDAQTELNAATPRPRQTRLYHAGRGY